MIIKLSPQRGNSETVADRAGDVLTVNGVTYDFSVIPPGATLPAEAIDGNDVLGAERDDSGKLTVTLRIMHGPDAPEATRFPEPIIDPPDGVIDLPPYNEVPEHE